LPTVELICLNLQENSRWVLNEMNGLPYVNKKFIIISFELCQTVLPCFLLINRSTLFYAPGHWISRILMFLTNTACYFGRKKTHFLIYNINSAIAMFSNQRIRQRTTFLCNYLSPFLQSLSRLNFLMEIRKLLLPKGRE
jgi:hypothetical protein